MDGLRGVRKRRRPPRLSPRRPRKRRRPPRLSPRRPRPLPRRQRSWLVATAAVAATATTAAAAAAAAATVLTGTRDVDGDRTATDLGAVDRVDGRLALRVVRHLDEAET